MCKISKKLILFSVVIFSLHTVLSAMDTRQKDQATQNKGQSHTNQSKNNTFFGFHDNVMQMGTDMFHSCTDYWKQSTQGEKTVITLTAVILSYLCYRIFPAVSNIFGTLFGFGYSYLKFNDFFNLISDTSAASQ